MPKALAKSKHGCKATVQQQSMSSQGDLVSKPSQGADISNRPKAIDAWAHHKGTDFASAPSCAERRRDKFLKKLCAKASDLRLSSPIAVSLPSEARIRDPPSTPDQISLQDCPLDIQTSNLWGTTPNFVSTETSGPLSHAPSSEPPPASASAPVRTSTEVGPAHDLA